MVENYRFNRSELETATQQHKQVLDQIIDAHSNANQILTEIMDNDVWQGQQREEFLAFLRIIVSYHGDLIGAESHESKGNDPYQKFVSGLEQLNVNLSGYTGVAGSYKELERL